MPLYYRGDLQQDLASIKNEKHLPALKQLTAAYGYGRIRATLIDILDSKMQKSPTTTHQVLPNDTVEYIEKIGEETGFRRSIDIIQILWADYLRGKGIPTSGALGNLV